MTFFIWDFNLEHSTIENIFGCFLSLEFVTECIRGLVQTLWANKVCKITEYDYKRPAKLVIGREKDRQKKTTRADKDQWAWPEVNANYGRNREHVLLGDACLISWIQEN